MVPGRVPLAGLSASGGSFADMLVALLAKSMCSVRRTPDDVLAKGKQSAFGMVGLMGKPGAPNSLEVASARSTRCMGDGPGQGLGEVLSSVSAAPSSRRLRCPTGSASWLGGTCGTYGRGKPGSQ